VVFCGYDVAEPGDHVKQPGVEAVEGIVRQVGEQLAREAMVTVKESVGGSASSFREGDKCRAAVGGMRLAGHEPGGHQAVDQRRCARDSVRPSRARLSAMSRPSSTVSSKTRPRVVSHRSACI
jgi:hypothetical protein